MKSLLLLTGFAVCLGGTLALAEEPVPEPPIPQYFPIPELPGMPSKLAKKMKCDMERVNRDIHRAMNGLPFEPPAFDAPRKFRNDFPVIPQDFGRGGFAVNDQTSSSWSSVNGKFCMNHRKNDVSYKVTGQMLDGVAVPSSILVKEGRDSTTYENMEQVPDSHRKAIEELLTDRE